MFWLPSRTNWNGQTSTISASCSPNPAGSHAPLVIWVSPLFRYEHAQALHRLNEWTAAGVRFYGVKIEAVLTSRDSDPKPRFRKVVYPGGWNKKETWRSGQPGPESLRYQEFFEPVIAELLSSGPFDRSPIQSVPHGMRSSFRDWCGETGISREMAERALGHEIRNAVEKAYARTDLLERRREPMEQWSSYLDN